MTGAVRSGPLLAVLLAGLASCASPPATPASRLGYGTPGVETYVDEATATSLRAQLERCRQVPDGPDGVAASCAQLRRTYRNQPGNAVGR